MPTPREELSHLTLDDLVDEIRARTSASVVICTPHENTTTTELAVGWYAGGFAACICLLQIQLWRMERKNAENEE